MNKQWLDNLKVGDQIIQRAGGGIGSKDVIGTVNRLTQTLIVAENGCRYNRATGRAPGSGYFHGFIEEPTKEICDKINHESLAGFLTRFLWHNESLETLRQVREILKNAIKK